MLYLAQVQRNLTSGEIQLRLLSYQKPDLLWEKIDLKFINLPENPQFNERVLVLVSLDKNNEITEIQEATNWVLGLIEQYLTNPILTPDFMKEEAARVEEWRQEIALKNQDLTRRHLEMETQREQLQELADTLKLEQEKIELRRKELEEHESKV
jgi:hypothetical protein